MLEDGARGGRRPEGAERVPASRAESRARLLLGDELVEDVPFCRASFAEARSNWSTETVGRSTVSTTLLALARSPSLSSSHSRPLSGSAFTSTTKSNCLRVHCGLVGFCMRTLQALSASPKLPCGKRSTRHQARDAAPHSSSSAHGSEENAGLSGESGESGALMRGIRLTVCPRARTCWHPDPLQNLRSRVTTLRIRSEHRRLCYIFEFFDYLSPAYPEKPNSGRLNPFRSSTGLSTSIESFQRGKSSNLGRELHERPGKYGR